MKNLIKQGIIQTLIDHYAKQHSDHSFILAQKNKKKQKPLDKSILLYRHKQKKEQNESQL